MILHETLLDGDRPVSIAAAHVVTAEPYGPDRDEWITVRLVDGQSLSLVTTLSEFSQRWKEAIWPRMARRAE